jgi:hypothetical protein
VSDLQLSGILCLDRGDLKKVTQSASQILITTAVCLPLRCMLARECPDPDKLITHEISIAMSVKKLTREIILNKN